MSRTSEDLRSIIPGAASHDLNTLATDLVAAVPNPDQMTTQDMVAAIHPTLDDCLPWYLRTAAELGFRGVRKRGSLRVGLRLPAADNRTPHRPRALGNTYDLGKGLDFTTWTETVREFANAVDGSLGAPIENYRIEAALADMLSAYPDVFIGGPGTWNRLTRHLDVQKILGILNTHYFHPKPHTCRRWSPQLDAEHGPFMNHFTQEPYYL